MSRREILAGALAAPFAMASAAAPRARPPAGRLARLGASTACLAGASLLDAVAHIQRLGFGTIELIAYTGARHSVGEIPGFSYHDASAFERSRVFAATRPFAHITAHLPFTDVHLFSSTTAERDAGLARLRQAIDGLHYLEGELGVMHVGRPGKGQRYRDIWGTMVDTLRALGAYAAERGIDLALETMQPDSTREYIDLISAVDHPRVGAAIDTGHIRGSTEIGLPPERRDTDEARARFNDVLNALVRDLGRKVFHFHLSDVRRADWVDHRTIGSGIIDFPRLFATVRGMQYNRVFVFELEEPDTLGALERSRAHVEPLLPRP